MKRLLIDFYGWRKDDFDWRVGQSPTDLATLGSVCVLHLNDKLGDAILISLLVDALAKERPDLPISVGTTAAFVEYWRRNSLVRQVGTFPPSAKMRRNTLRRLREATRAARPWRGRFDAVVSFEPYARPDHFALVRTLGARVNVGFNKHGFRLFTYSLEERRHGVVAEPVAARTARVMEVFGRSVDLEGLRASVPFDEDDARAADRLLGDAEAGPRLLLNTYGATPEKRLSPAATASCVREIRAAGFDGLIFLSVAKGEEPEYRELGATVLPPVPDVFKLFALISRVDAVVSPDTAVGHVAAAFGKPQVCLFARGGALPMAWRPLGDRCEIVVSKGGREVSDLDLEALARAIRATVARQGDLWDSSRA